MFRQLNMSARTERYVFEIETFSLDFTDIDNIFRDLISAAKGVDRVVLDLTLRGVAAPSLKCRENCCNHIEVKSRITNML